MGVFRKRERYTEPVPSIQGVPIDMWVLATPNGHGYVWPCIDGYVPNTGQRYFHWRATIRHHQIGAVEGIYATPEVARAAAEAMLDGQPYQWITV